MVEILRQEGAALNFIWFFATMTIGSLVCGFGFYLSKIVKEHSKFWYNFLRYFIPFIVVMNLIMCLLNICFNFIV